MGKGKDKPGTEGGEPDILDDTMDEDDLTSSKAWQKGRNQTLQATYESGTFRAARAAPNLLGGAEINYTR